MNKKWYTRTTWKEFNDAGLLLILNALFDDNVSWRYNEDNDIVMANELHIPIDKCIYYKYMPNLNKNKLYLLDKRLVTVNKLLHVFGWSIMVYADDEVRKIYNIFPVRTSYRGFKESAPEDIENYVKISEWMSKNADELLNEARS